MNKTNKKLSLQSAVLKKLEEYGDSLLESDDYEKKKKKKKKANKQKIETESENDLHCSKLFPQAQPNTEKAEKKRKKKKKKKSKNEVSEDSIRFSQDFSPLSGVQKHLSDLSMDLGLDEFKRQRIEARENQMSSGQGKSDSVPEIIIFSNRAKKKKAKPNKPTESQPSKNEADDNPDFDMRQARYEVRKFGIKGLLGSQKDEAMTSLLISLGAKSKFYEIGASYRSHTFLYTDGLKDGDKVGAAIATPNGIILSRPLKNTYYNYKEFQEMRKKHIQEETERRDLERKLGYKVVNPNKGKKRQRTSNDIGIVDGQVGRYKSGVQYVKKEDLIGFKKQRRK